MCIRDSLVGDERDRVGVGTERRTGQRQAADGRLEGLEAGLAPGLRVTGVVDLVHDHEGLAGLGAVAVQHRVHADARVGDHDAVVVLRERTRGVRRVEPDAYPRRRLRPLLLQVLGRRDDGDLLHQVVVQQVRGQGQRESGLACARGRDRQEVAGLLLDVPVQCTLLPGPELARGTPGGTAGEGRGQVVRGRGGSAYGGVRVGIREQRSHRGSGGSTHGLRGGSSQVRAVQLAPPHCRTAVGQPAYPTGPGPSPAPDTARRKVPAARSVHCSGGFGKCS